MKKIYGVVGHPVSHSLSPAMHEAAFKHLGIDAEYRAFDVRPGDVGGFIRVLRKENIFGLSVTTPHKHEVMPFLHRIDNVAVKIGAVNTVYMDEDEYVGTNTDFIGIKNALGNVKGKKILLLGAGGAAEAACYALSGADVTIWNRTYERGKELALEWGFSAVESIEGLTPEIVINCTSVDDPVDSSVFGRTVAVAFDVGYGPKKRKFVSDAEKAGVKKVIRGEKMLLEQGYAAFELWTGQKAPKEVMESAVMSLAGPV